MKFHEELGHISLDHECTFCHASLPIVAVSGSTECKRCKMDNAYPKLYSAQNNMDPGCIPSQLQVSVSHCPCSLLYIGERSNIWP